MNRESKSGKLRNFPLGPIILVSLGLVFLLNNFGILPWDIWQNIWKFWPIFLILIGLEILVGKKASLRGFFILAILVFIIPIILIFNPLGQNPLINANFNFEKPIGTLTHARIEVSLPTSNVEVNALENGSLLAVKGDIRYSQVFPKPELKTEDQFNQGLYSLSQEKKTVLPFLSGFASSSSFSVSRLIPVEVIIKTTAGKNNLDFSSLKLDNLMIETGATQTFVAFSQNFSTKAFLKTGTGLLTLKIPNGIEASIKTNSGIKSISIDEKRFQKSGETYKTKNFDSATTRIQIEVSSSAASLTVN